MAFAYTFQRFEKKYLLTKEQRENLLCKLSLYIKPDNYGISTICNIYYDTVNYELIRRSIEKPPYKEKLRLRSYGIPTYGDTVFLEIKKKYNGTVYKRRISLSLAEAENYLDRGIIPEIDSQIFHEIDYFITFYRPAPSLFLAYDRIAYYGCEDNSLRITFDENIRSRRDRLSLSLGDNGTMLMPCGSSLMEIKISGAMPLWLTRILSDEKIYPASFSKYGNIYEKEKINQGEITQCSTVS